MDDLQVEMCIRNLLIGFLSGKKEPCGPCNYYIEGDNITFDSFNGSGTIQNRGENILFKYKNCTVNLQKKR
ncbi:MAG: hypothetical protein LBK58_07765 [Prevotellaceae bacterium]|jgi:hypothetical protein|nr:hypothetical protein [Prevotellaceae bacterium]